MVDYCTSADVIANLKGFVVTSSSSVTTATLAEMVSEESAVIDQHIRPHYTLPVSDSVALLLLKKIAIDLVVYRASKVLQPESPVPIPDQDGKGVAQGISHVSAYREAMTMLKDLKNGKTTLPGESVTATNFIKSSAVDDDDPAAFDFRDSEGNPNINVDLW